MDFPKLTKEQRRALEVATSKYEDALDEALDWLEDRGIPEKVARKARLGFVDEPEVGHEPAEGFLAIPYLTPSGVISLRFRALDDRTKDKYWQPAGSSSRLYNVPVLHERTDHIAIAEGELDALVLDRLCGVPAVGLPGARNWKAYWGRLFQDYDTVYIVMDGDKTGRDAAEDLKRKLPNSVIVDIGDGLDVNDAYLEYGPEYVRERLGLK